MTKILRTYNWDLIIPKKSLPIIVMEGGKIPMGAISTRTGVFVRRQDNIYHLAKSESIAARISAFDQIIVAKADEGLLRKTKIRHHWRELIIELEQDNGKTT
jgi:hypothetical protein